MKAYLLIQTETTHGPIAETLLGIAGVISAHDLTGPFDAIALARAESTGALAEGVLARIQALPGVIRALSAPLIGAADERRGSEPVSEGTAA